jgi:hypothetical protein
MNPLLLLAMFATSSMYAKPCPAVIGIAADGSIYDDRGGAWVRQNPKIVEEVLGGGCYPEGGPSPTSSVLLELAPHAPKARIDLVYSILERTGWPRAKVNVVVWANAPRRPSGLDR